MLLLPLALGLKSELWMRSDSLPLSLTCQEGKIECVSTWPLIFSRREAEQGV